MLKTVNWEKKMKLNNLKPKNKNNKQKKNEL